VDEICKAGKIKGYGVSVEKVEEALKAVEYPNVVSIQIIFNVFRQRPVDLFFKEARRRNIAVIARVPLASGLLSGKITRETKFAPDDHRTFNRHGEAFDVGETFAGVPLEIGLQAVDALKKLVPQGANMAKFALRWILMHDTVTVVIPGARNAQQARANAEAAALPPLSDETMAAAREVYDRLVAPHVHQRW
jgi:aryl-alcohol dehydrogenase-like predicted oxidoreductase